MKFHPLADCFPLIEGEQFSELVKDIGTHGLNHPIVVHEGMVLDGRNRWRACQELGIAHREQQFTGSDPVAYVWSENAVRRHLTVGQKSMAAAEMANVKHGGPREGKVSEPNEQAATWRLATDASTTSARALAAATVAAVSASTGIPQRNIERAKAVARTAVPEVTSAVRAGTLPLGTAERIAKQKPETQRRLVAVENPAAIRAAIAKETQASLESDDMAPARRIASLSVVPPVSPAYGKTKVDSVIRKHLPELQDARLDFSPHLNADGLKDVKPKQLEYWSDQFASITTVLNRFKDAVDAEINRRSE